MQLDLLVFVKYTLFGVIVIVFDVVVRGTVSVAYDDILF